MYLVSACLAGFNTRYDGTNSLDEKVERLVAEGRAVPVCPEQLAGLPTPRPYIEFRNGDGKALLNRDAKAIGKDGFDYSKTLWRGAAETLRIAKLYGIKEAILKDGSPSCGTTYVRIDGSKCHGKGVTAAMLESEGLMVRTVDTL